MDKIIKFWLFLVFLPALLCVGLQAMGIVLQMLLAAAMAILPWVILLMLVVSAVAGLSAGIALRRRLPPPAEPLLPPPGFHSPIRRPRQTHRPQFRE